MQATHVARAKASRAKTKLNTKRALRRRLVTCSVPHCVRLGTDGGQCMQHAARLHRRRVAAVEAA